MEDKQLGFHDDILLSFSVDITNLTAQVVIQTHDWVEEPEGDKRGGKVFHSRVRGITTISLDLDEHTKCFWCDLDESMVNCRDIGIIVIKDDILRVFVGMSEMAFAIKGYKIFEGPS